MAAIFEFKRIIMNSEINLISHWCYPLVTLHIHTKISPLLKFISSCTPFKSLNDMLHSCVCLIYPQWCLNYPDKVCFMHLINTHVPSGPTRRHESYRNLFSYIPLMRPAMPLIRPPVSLLRHADTHNYSSYYKLPIWHGNAYYAAW